MKKEGKKGNELTKINNPNRTAYEMAGQGYFDSESGYDWESTYNYTRPNEYDLANLKNNGNA